PSECIFRAWRNARRGVGIFSPSLSVVPLIALSLALQSCGGDGGAQMSPPPPMPDFTLSVSPSSASAVLGNTSSAVTVSVSPLHGFDASVSVNLLGLPAGVTASPASSFTLQSGASQKLNFS